MTDKIVAFAESSGVQGINIYFEHLSVDDRDAFSAFVAGVDAALGEKNVLLNTCVHFAAGSATDAAANAYDYATLASSSDHLLLMAFEQYGLSSETAGPICSYDWLYNNIIKMLTVVSSDQMVLVMPFYGRDYRFDESGKALWHEDNKQAPVVSYAQVEELYLQSQYYDSNEELTNSADTLLQEDVDKTYRNAFVKFTSSGTTTSRLWLTRLPSPCITHWQAWVLTAMHLLTPCFGRAFAMRWISSIFPPA